MEPAQVELLVRDRAASSGQGHVAVPGKTLVVLGGDGSLLKAVKMQIWKAHLLATPKNLTIRIQ